MEEEKGPGVPVFRPNYLTDGLEFSGHLVESPSNIFYQSVKASRATIASTGAGRFQFQWRSVSDNLLMSPTVMLRFQLQIDCPVLWNQITQFIPVRGVRAATATTEAGVYASTANDTMCQGPPAICFADGDAFTSCCSAINLNFNGTSLSLNRSNYFWRDFLRMQVSSEDAARIYKSCGGAYDAADSVGVCVPQYKSADGTAMSQQPLTAGRGYWSDAVQAGVTVDSGIAERCKALYSLLEPVTGTNGSRRILQVSYPVPVAPFNPFRNYAIPASSPYKSCPLAIPHLSAGGLDFLIEDFQTAFLRRMGMCVPNANDGVAGAAVARGAGGYDASVGAGTNSGAIGISLVDGSAELELKYFRLMHTRALKESYRFNVWQAQTFLGELPPLNTQGHVDEGDGKGRTRGV